MIEKQVVLPNPDVHFVQFKVSYKKTKYILMKV